MRNNQVAIRRYGTEYESQLLALIEREGEEWKDYWLGTGREKYKKALSRSITCLIFEDTERCGYARCRDDDGFGIYVYDLLVNKNHRGKGYGRMLMDQACLEFPNDPVYVMSDVNSYYEKLGCEVEGAIYIVKPSHNKSAIAP